MTTRNETNEGIDVNEGIAHRMVRCVGRAVNSFLAPSDTVRKLDILIEEAKEEDKFLEKETEHLRKVDDYLLSELKARGLTYPPLASELKARGLTYPPVADATAAAAAPTAAPDRAPASVSIVPVSRNNMNDGIDHPMGQRVRRSTNSFLAFLTKPPIDRLRLLEELIEMAEEDHIRSTSIELREKENRQQSKVKRFLENQLKARGLTYVPSANATKNEELAEMVDVLNAKGGSDVAKLDSDV